MGSAALAAASVSKLRLALLKQFEGGAVAFFLFAGFVLPFLLSFKAAFEVYRQPTLARGGRLLICANGDAKASALGSTERENF
jgi:hypothetical protein